MPMARGLEPYCKVYVAAETGVFLYNWRTNGLDEISKDDIRAKSGSQNFVKSASSILIVTADSKALEAFNERDGRDFANVAAGAMTQDIYLASAALGVGTRYIHSMREDDIRAALRLGERDWPICLMMLGK